jgi:DNA-binding response OmpR family regulator
MSSTQCSVLYLNPCCRGGTQAAALRSLGFAVMELDDLPMAERLVTFHAVVCRARAQHSLPTIAARLRAKPHFGRRVLIALAPPERSERDRREAVDAGFDCVLPDCCSPRQLAAAIIRYLRPYPEYRCLLKPKGRRKAA